MLPVVLSRVALLCCAASHSALALRARSRSPEYTGGLWSPWLADASRASSPGEGAGADASKKTLGGDTDDGGIQLLTSVKPCRDFSHPLADFDLKKGHGNADCRYEPPAQELQRYRERPEDIAIVMPHDKLDDSIPEDVHELSGYGNFSAYMWRAYARFHGYAFYVGKPPQGDRGCRGREERRPEWIKPCTAMQLLPKHRFLMMVDSDTLVLKPRLRLEPLFARAGIIPEVGGRSVMAVAEEWGSCMDNTGSRRLMAGAFNTGVMLIRRSEEVSSALSSWYDRPSECQRKLQQRRRSQDVPQGEREWCKELARSLTTWSFDQKAFELAVWRDLKDQITVLKSGCPLNSPWGDFVAHLVGGTVHSEYYCAKDRDVLFAGAARWIDSVLSDPGRANTTRCSLCDLIARERSFASVCGRQAWTISCPDQIKN